jgi:GT2 family glycosyltransferase
MRRDTFLATGGFDERYVGYGGEDTDFGKVVAQAGVPIGWIRGGLAYHQYHPHHMPPVHHLDSVVRNAEVFEAKWGYRTMDHWLHAFSLMGLIDAAPGRPIRILRAPDDADRALTGQQRHQPYANTASVIRQLEARAA